MFGANLHIYIYIPIPIVASTRWTSTPTSARHCSLCASGDRLGLGVLVSTKDLRPLTRMKFVVHGVGVISAVNNLLHQYQEREDSSNVKLKLDENAPLPSWTPSPWFLHAIWIVSDTSVKGSQGLLCKWFLKQRFAELF